MPFITFIEHGGAEHQLEAEEGQSLMELAIANSIPGIDADCGGCCGCGTCHVIIDLKWLKAAGEISDEEQLMLDLTPEKTSTSRLSCQVHVNTHMEGMIVRLPEFQM